MDSLILRSTELDSGVPLKTQPLLEISAAPATPAAASHPSTPPTADLASESGILSALRSRPDVDTVTQILSALASESSGFNIRRAASSFASQAVQCLTSDILPAFWPVLSSQEKLLLSTCLHSPIGLGSIVARLKALLAGIKAAKEGSVDAQKADVDNILSLLQMILGRPGVVLNMWTTIEGIDTVKRSLLWKEYCTLVGGSRLLGIAAEAEHVLGRSTPGAENRWVGDGRRWAIWLGKELAVAAKGIKADGEVGWAALGSFLAASFRLGYTGE